MFSFVLFQKAWSARHENNCKLNLIPLASFMHATSLLLEQIMKQFAHLRVSLKVEKFLAEFKCSTNSRSFVSMSGDDEVLNESLSALVSFVSLSSSSNLNKLLSSTKRCSENSHKFKFDIKRLRSSSSWRWWKLSCRSTNCIVNFSSSILSDISRYTYIDLQKHIRFIRQRASRTKYDVNVFAVRKDLACFIIKCTTPAHHERAMLKLRLWNIVKHCGALSVCSCLCWELFATSLDIHVELLLCWFHKFSMSKQK